MLLITYRSSIEGDKNCLKMKSFCFPIVWSIPAIHRLISNGIWQKCGSLGCIPWCICRGSACSAHWCELHRSLCWGERIKFNTPLAIFQQNFQKTVKYPMPKLPSSWMNRGGTVNSFMYQQLCSRETIKQGVTFGDVIHCYCTFNKNCHCSKSGSC